MREVESLESIVSSRQSAVDSQQSTVCQEGRAKKIVLIILFQAAKFCKLNMTIKTKLNDEITELVRRENTGNRTGDVSHTSVGHTSTSLINNGSPAIIVHLSRLLAQS